MTVKPDPVFTADLVLDANGEVMSTPQHTGYYTFTHDIQVRVKKLRQFKIRIWIAYALCWLASKISPAEFNVHTD